MKIRPGIVVTAIVVASALQCVWLLFVPSIEQVKLALMLQVALLCAFTWWSVRVSRTYLNAPLILLTAIFFWHSSFLAAHFLVPIEQFQDTGSTFLYGSEFIPQGVALISLCMVCTAAGILWAFHAMHRRANAVAADRGTPRFSRTAAMFAWTCLLVFAVITAVDLIFEGPQRFKLTYLETYLQESESLLERVYQGVKFFGVPTILMVFAARRKRGVSMVALAISGGLVFVGLLLGSRSIPFLYLAAVLVSIDRFGRRLSLVEVAALFAGGSALSFIVDQARANGLGFRVFDLARTGRSLDLLQIFSNAGGTVKTILRTFAFLGDTGPIYGRSIGNAALYLLPRALVDGAGFRTGFVRPTDWLVARSADVPAGQSIGYSLVAEAYLNFGFVGCLLFVLLGWYVGRQYFRHVLTGDRIAWLRAYHITVLLSLHLRNDLAASLRVLVYGLLLIEAARWIQQRGLVVRFSRPAPARVASVSGAILDGP